MLHTTSVMADQIGESCVSGTMLLENAFSVNAVKEEGYEDGDFIDDKVQISETAVITELQGEINQYDTSSTLCNIKTEPSLPEIPYYLMPENLKMEEGISTDYIKSEFNRGLLYCEQCQVYREDYCAECDMLVHILNKSVPINADNKSQAELPKDILEIRHSFRGYHIFAVKDIPAGVTFGPFTGLNTAGDSWKIKGGKFVVNKNKSKYLNWMQYINPAMNITEKNLQVFQYGHNLYYESTRRIEEGDELLVHFGEEYEDSLNRSIEMDFIPTVKHIFKDVFACTFCCLGFKSKSYLAKHKTICPAAGEYTIEDVMQCPSCKIHLDQKEYLMHHMAYCCKKNDRKCNQATATNRRKTRPRQIYKCQQCKYRTKYKGDLKKHTTLHNEVKMHKCGICRQRFKAKEVLWLHMESIHINTGEKTNWEHFTENYMKPHIKTERSLSHDEMEQFKCSLCAFRTKYKLSIQRHMAVQHSKELNYKCDRCSYKTNWEDYLKIHMETKHLKEFKYKCDTCDYKTNRKCYLKEHIEAKHLNEFKYKCDLCDFKSNQKSNLKTHIEARHLKEFKYRCDICDYKANQKSHLNNHIDARHLNEFNYECDTCDYKSNQKSNLKTHVQTKHLNERKYKCDTCDFRTNRKFQLKSHIEIKHLKEFKYKCDLCEYKTKWKSYLKVHIETKHLNEFKYKCETCDYKTNLKNNLKTHTETKHLKEFKYECDTCEYRANQKHYLQIHIKTKHLKEFKYKCDWCDYKTNVKTDLNTHVEAKHLKVFKYECNVCDYKASRKSSLKNHIETIHLNEFNYKCKSCKYKTNDMSNLRRHINAKH